MNRGGHGAVLLRVVNKVLEKKMVPFRKLQVFMKSENYSLSIIPTLES